MHPALPICLVFLGCCSNVVFLELLVSEMPGSGNIVTFSQFLFIAIEGFIFTAKFGTVAPSIPMKNYVLMVIMFFFVQVINNLALNFHISMPLHMIFRAGSLMANLILGIIILKRSYKMSKYLSVLMISIGIVLCTIASSSEVKSGAEGDAVNESYEYLTWLIGIGMLVFALFMSARMGIFQETIYSKFGKHPSEALFYNHALPLPGFLFFTADIYKHALMFTQSAPMLIPVLNIAMPKMWIYLIGNILTQYVCIRSVFILTTECTSLTVTLVVTLRKFVSLIFSIWYFQNPFTTFHWIGASLVFIGTFIFTEVLQKLQELIVPKKKHL